MGFDCAEGAEDHSLVVGHHMRVGVQRLFHGAMTEVATDGDDGHTLMDQERSTAVAQVVNADALDA